MRKLILGTLVGLLPAFAMAGPFGGENPGGAAASGVSASTGTNADITALNALTNINTATVTAKSGVFNGQVFITTSEKNALYVGPGISSPTIETGFVEFSTQVTPASGLNSNYLVRITANVIDTFRFNPTAGGVAYRTFAASGTLTSPAPFQAGTQGARWDIALLDATGVYRISGTSNFTTDTTTGAIANSLPGSWRWSTVNQASTSNSERMRLTSSGTLAIGLTSEVATRLELTDTSGSSPVFKVNGAGSSVFQMDNTGGLQLTGAGGKWNSPVTFSGTAPVTFSSAAIFGIIVATQATAGAGAATTATCPSGKYAMTGGCSCTGGVALTGYLDTIGAAFPAAGVGIQNTWTCQAPGGTGGTCAAWVQCSVIQ